MTTIAEKVGLPTDLDLDKPNAPFVCGTEYEIESIKAVRSPISGQLVTASSVMHWYDTNLGIVIDNSLRNNGVEIITKPVTFNKALDLFHVVHSPANLVLGENPYSHRTSTHVHVNVRGFTSAQLKQFILLYALFEPIFFDFAGPTRKYNIHCVPLTFTLLPKYYKSHSSLDLVSVWSKYTAFNVRPVVSQGTVEFRHLYGTGDYEVYAAWLTLIEALWQASKNNPDTWLYSQLLKGQTTHQLASKVFGDFYPHLDFSASTIDVKLAFV